MTYLLSKKNEMFLWKNLKIYLGLKKNQRSKIIPKLVHYLPFEPNIKKSQDCDVAAIGIWPAFLYIIFILRFAFYSMQCIIFYAYALNYILYIGFFELYACIALNFIYLFALYFTQGIICIVINVSICFLYNTK